MFAEPDFECCRSCLASVIRSDRGAWQLTLEQEADEYDGAGLASRCQ